MAALKISCDYGPRLRELYRALWLSENLPAWLPNILQLYDRNSQMWQAQIEKFDTIAVQHRQAYAFSGVAGPLGPGWRNTCLAACGTPMRLSPRRSRREARREQHISLCED